MHWLLSLPATQEHTKSPIKGTLRDTPKDTNSYDGHFPEAMCESRLGTSHGHRKLSRRDGDEGRSLPQKGRLAGLMHKK